MVRGNGESMALVFDKQDRDQEEPARVSTSKKSKRSREKTNRNH